MERRQLVITITAVALVVVFGAGIALLATSGADDERVATGSLPTTRPTLPLPTAEPGSTTSTTTPSRSSPSPPARRPPWS